MKTKKTLLAIIILMTTTILLSSFFVIGTNNGAQEQTASTNSPAFLSCYANRFVGPATRVPMTFYGCGFAPCGQSGGYFNSFCHCDFSDSERKKMTCQGVFECPEGTTKETKSFDVTLEMPYTLLILEDADASNYKILIKENDENFQKIDEINISEVLELDFEGLHNVRNVFVDIAGTELESGELMDETLFIEFLIFQRRNVSIVTYELNLSSKKLTGPTISNQEFVEDIRRFLRKNIDPLQGYVFERVIPNAAQGATTYLMYRSNENMEEKRIARVSFEINENNLLDVKTADISKPFKVTDRSIWVQQNLLEAVTKLIPNHEARNMPDELKKLREELDLQIGSHVTLVITFKQGEIINETIIREMREYAENNNMKLSFNGTETQILFNAKKFYNVPTVFANHEYLYISHGLSVFDTIEYARRVSTSSLDRQKINLTKLFDEELQIINLTKNTDAYNKAVSLHQSLLGNRTSAKLYLAGAERLLALENKKLTVKDYETETVTIHDEVEPLPSYERKLQAEVFLTKKDFVDDDTQSRLPINRNLNMMVWFDEKKNNGPVAGYQQKNICTYRIKEQRFSIKSNFLDENYSEGLPLNIRRSDDDCYFEIENPNNAYGGLKIGSLQNSEDKVYTIIYEAIIEKEGKQYLVKAEEELRFHNAGLTLKPFQNRNVQENALSLGMGVTVEREEQQFIDRVFYEVENDIFNQINLETITQSRYYYDAEKTITSCFVPDTEIDFCRRRGGEWFSTYLPAFSLVSTDTITQNINNGFKGLEVITIPEGQKTEADKFFLENGFKCYLNTSKEDQCGARNQLMCAYGCDGGLSPCGEIGICLEECVRGQDYSLDNWKKNPDGTYEIEKEGEEEPTRITEAEDGVSEEKEPKTRIDPSTKVYINDIRITTCEPGATNWNLAECDPKYVSKEVLQSESYSLYVKASGINCENFHSEGYIKVIFVSTQTGAESRTYRIRENHGDYERCNIETNQIEILHTDFIAKLTTNTDTGATQNGIYTMDILVVNKWDDESSSHRRGWWQSVPGIINMSDGTPITDPVPDEGNLVLNGCGAGTILQRDKNLCWLMPLINPGVSRSDAQNRCENSFNAALPAIDQLKEFYEECEEQEDISCEKPTGMWSSTDVYATLTGNTIRYNRGYKLPFTCVGQRDSFKLEEEYTDQKYNEGDDLVLNGCGEGTILQKSNNICWTIPIFSAAKKNVAQSHCQASFNADLPTLEQIRSFYDACDAQEGMNCNKYHIGIWTRNEVYAPRTGNSIPHSNAYTLPYYCASLQTTFTTQQDFLDGDTTYFSVGGCNFPDPRSFVEGDVSTILQINKGPNYCWINQNGEFFTLQSKYVYTKRFCESIGMTLPTAHQVSSMANLCNQFPNERLCIPEANLVWLEGKMIFDREQNRVVDTVRSGYANKEAYRLCVRNEPHHWIDGFMVP